MSGMKAGLVNAVAVDQPVAAKQDAVGILVFQRYIRDQPVGKGISQTKTVQIEFGDKGSLVDGIVNEVAR